MAKIVDTDYTSKFNLPMPIGRLNPTPADSSYVWDTYSELALYAASDPTAYVGQILYSKDTNKIYQIEDTTGNLKIIGDYNDAENKPSINNVELSGNKTSAQLGLQSQLTSGTSIKTINGESLLGSGDIVVSGAVTSVNSKVGTVVLNQDDIGDGTTYKQTHNDFTDTYKNQIGTNTTNIGLNTTAIGNNTTAIGGNTTSINTINSKIPEQATSSNQLADKEFVNSSISHMAANYVASNVAGDAFATRAALIAGPYYHSGSVYTPTNNDYAVVSEDEQHQNKQARYVYVKAQGSSTGTWSFQYVINATTFTAEQMAAINSGATTSNIGQIATNTAAIATKQDTLIGTETTGQNIKTINGNSILGTGNVKINSGEWGKITGTLSEQDDLNTALTNLNTSKQNKLVWSGTGQNIKTIGGTELGGSGNIPLDRAIWGNITGSLSSQRDLNTALSGKVDANDSITSATKSKITYDSKGLVTGGSDLIASDIPALPTSKITGLDSALAGKASTAVATTSANGLMSSSDKTKLNGIETGAKNLTFTNGTGNFTITDGSGNTQTVAVGTVLPANNVTGSGTSGYLTKFNGNNTITNGPQLGSSTSTFLRNDGTWASPGGNVTGVKGSSESSYRTGQVNITLANLGVSADAAEINKLDGLDTTKAELGYVHGVTSDIQTQLNSKQATLVNQSNIKSINNVSLLGAGNISVDAKAEWGSITGSISAQTDLNNAFQKTLVSGTNIKSLNGQSMVGSGNLIISGQEVFGVFEVTLGTTWTYDSSTSMYYQDITSGCQNVTAADVPFIDIKLSNNRSTIDAELREYAKVVKLETGAAKIRAWAWEQTTVQLTLLVRGCIPYPSGV